jgi:hypothetical protein
VAANKFLEACVAQGVGWVGEDGEQVLVGFGVEIAGFDGHRILICTSMTSDAILGQGRGNFDRWGVEGRAKKEKPGGKPGLWRLRHEGVIQSMTSTPMERALPARILIAASTS